MTQQDDMKNGMAGFFPEYYLARHPDLRNAFGTDQKAAWKHYLQFGIDEGREPNPFFDPIFYRDNNPDLNTFSGQDLLEHWVKHGVVEGRRGSVSFSSSFYLKSHPDLVKVFGSDLAAAFNHWKSFGNPEARITAPGRILRLFDRDIGGDMHEIVARTGAEGADPDLFKPHNTTGGQIGFGIGLVVGTFKGGPAGGAAGAATGSLIGHGLDRVFTRVANDITGPFLTSLEKGPIGKVLGDFVGKVGNIKLPDGFPRIKFPKLPS